MRLDQLTSAMLGVCLALAACVTTDAGGEVDAALFNGTAPSGFDAITVVTLDAAVYPVTTQDDFVLAGGAFPVRRVAQDRVRIGFTGMSVLRPDGTEDFVPAPPSFTTEPTVRVGGTDEKLAAVFAALSFCGLPLPDADTLYLWGDEYVTRAEDTREWQFTQLC